MNIAETKSSQYVFRLGGAIKFWGGTPEAAEADRLYEIGLRHQSQLRSLHDFMQFDTKRHPVGSNTRMFKMQHALRNYRAQKHDIDLLMSLKMEVL